MDQQLTLFAGLDIFFAVCTLVFLVRLIRKTKECGRQGYALKSDWARLITDFCLSVFFGVWTLVIYNFHLWRFFAR